MWGPKLLFLIDSSQMQASVHVDCKCTQKLVEHFRPPLAFGCKIISRSEAGSLDGGSEGFWKASATLCYFFNFPNKHLQGIPTFREFRLRDPRYFLI